MNEVLLSWSNQGSLLDKYVKLLWIGIRAQRPKLEALGIDVEVNKKIFDWEFFIPTVDKVCRRKLFNRPRQSPPLILTTPRLVFRSRFRQAMETPNQTVLGLIPACDTQTTSWPADGAGIIYVRVYTQLDANPPDPNNTGIYVGVTIHASDRDEAHRHQTSKPARVTDRPTHYDIARKARSCKVLVALHQNKDETLAAGGTPQAKKVAEQTILLMLGSYAPWAVASQRIDVLLQRARLLWSIDRIVRAKTGFQPGWKIGHGTNVSSPLFESFYDREFGRSVAALVQTSTAIPPHPRLPGKTVTHVCIVLQHHSRGGCAGSIHGSSRWRPDSDNPNQDQHSKGSRGEDSGIDRTHAFEHARGHPRPGTDGRRPQS